MKTISVLEETPPPTLKCKIICSLVSTLIKTQVIIKLSVPDEGYYKNELFTLNWISIFLKFIFGTVVVVIVWELDL